MAAHVRRTLFETNIAARRDPSGPRRRELLRDYWRLKARQMRGEQGPGHATFLGWQLEYFDLATFVFVIEEIFIERIYEVDLPPQPHIIDCGANIGLAAIFFARRHPGARIQVFEPGPETCAALRGNLARAGVSAELHEAAAAGHDGEITLYYDTAPGSVGSSTIQDAHAAAGSQRVRATRLSTHIHERVDLLKLDIEGAEHQVLAELGDAGALALVDRIVFEYNHHLGGRDDLSRTLRLLEDAGYAYLISAPLRTPFVEGAQQDLIVFAYRAEKGS